MTPSTRLGRRLISVALLMVLLTSAGTVGYMLLEGWTLVDSVYMTVITLSTVGFGEVRPLGPAGRIFTAVLILVGVGSAAYVFSSLADYIIDGELHGSIQRRRMQRKIDALNNHFIICGYGRVGRQVVRELDTAGADMVIIDSRSSIFDDIDERRYFFVVGDASDDDVLRQAGVERAKGLVAATGNDADNVFITLSARAINRSLTIVARGILADAERKLRKAGADQVILPHAIGGRRIAGVLLQPTVVDFLDVVMHSGDLELWLEEIRLSAGSQLCRQTVGQARVRTETGANVLAIKTAAGKLLTHVTADYRLAEGDVLVSLGTRQQLQALSDLASH